MLASEPAPSESLAILVDPLAVTVTAVSADSIALTVTYPGRVLGVAAKTVDTTMTIAGGLLVGAGYTLPGDPPTSVHTDFAPLAPTDQIVVPTG